MIDWHQGFVTFASAVAATVLNALWQDALLVLCVWLLLRAWPRVNAATRYIVWSATLAAAFVVPVATTLAYFTLPQTLSVAHASASAQNGPASKSPAKIVAARQRAAQPIVAVQRSPRLPERLRVTLPVSVASAVFVVWMLLAGYALVRLAIGLVRLEQLKRDALPLPVEYRDAMPQWLLANKGTRDVRLCVSDETDVPVAVGLFDAMILIPRSLLERLSEPEVDQICLHELAHLRRADDWTNGVQRVIAALLGWNPSVQFIGQQLDLEREVACDDWVLSFVGTVRPYALCLTKMAESALWPRHPIPAPGVFATRKHISLRIERLLGAGRNMATNLAIGPAAAAIGIVGAIALVIAIVAPSVAASEIAVPAKNAMPAAYALTPKNAAPARETTRIIRVVSVVTAPPSATTVTSGGRAHVSIPPVRVEVPKTMVVAPRTSINVPGVSFDVPGVDSKKLEGEIAESIASGLSDGAKVVAQTKTCVGCDYSGVNWAGKDLHGVSYNGVDFSKANLVGVNLSGSSLVGTDFTRANLSGASFRNARLTGCDFSNANLSGADFSGAQVLGCQFTGANLSSGAIRDVLRSCRGCDFSRADLAGLDLRAVTVRGGDFSGADLRGVNLSGATLVDSDFSNAKLDGADLGGATLNRCDLSGVDVTHLDLSKTKLIDTDLPGR